VPKTRSIPLSDYATVIYDDHSPARLAETQQAEKSSGATEASITNPWPHPRGSRVRDRDILG